MNLDNNKIYWGISSLSHDASLSVVKGSNILYASHAERYSRIKNESLLQLDQITEALSYGEPDKIFYFEDPFLKRLRFLKSLNLKEFFSSENSIKKHLKNLGLKKYEIETGNHHLSHAAGSYYTRPKNWKDSSVDVFVFDSIGEFETCSAFVGIKNTLTKIGSTRYPKSFGLFYSSVTQFVGLKPNEEEYILMGMAAYGSYVEELNEIFESCYKLNLHKGFNFSIETKLVKFCNEDIACTAQRFLEDKICKYILKNKKSDYLCLSGGVALNCVLNEKIAKTLGYKGIWIFPNPGDAGSSLGAISSKLNLQLNFNTCFLGTNISSKVQNSDIVSYLLQNKICGVARGRAEFGPRALGNRSIFADPRVLNIKDLVNETKNRQKFRPFSAAILKEFAGELFDTSNYCDYRYMSYAVNSNNKACQLRYPGIHHIDFTCRLQIVDESNPILQDLLYKWHYETNCPMLINTSLNVKGKPLVNTEKDAKEFEQDTKIKVFK